MNVYLYQSGTEKELKNAYIGKVYDYEYDFRGKTIAGMQSDGWTFGSTSGVTINSDGLKCDPFNASIYCQPSGLNLSNASKIIIERTYYKGGTYDGQSGSNCLTYLSGPSSYTDNGTGSGAGYSSGAYSVFMRVLGSELFRQTYTVANGTYTVTTVIDLVNKTMRLNFPGIVDTTKNITDAQINTIKTLKYIRIGGDTPAILKTINITVE